MKVRVLPGNYDGHHAAAETLTPIAYFDVALAPEVAFTHPVPDGHTALIYVYDGALHSSGGSASAVLTGTLAILSREGEIKVKAGSEGGKFLLLTGSTNQ